MKRTAILLLLWLPYVLTAQQNELMADPDVVWAAELSYDLNLAALRLDGSETNGGDLIRPRISTLKNQDADWEAKCDLHLRDTGPEMLMKSIFNALEEGGEVYRTEALQERLYPADIALMTSSVDTVITFDPATKEEKIFIVRSEINPADFNLFRIKQLFYYKASGQSLQSWLLAIAPVFTRATDEGILTKEPFFWMVPKDFGKERLDLHNPAVNLMKQIDFTVPAERLQVLKGKEKSLNEWLFEAAEAGQIEAYVTDGDCSPMSPPEIKALASSIDTVITFDSETFSETVMIVRNEFKKNELDKTRLLLEFYFSQDGGKMEFRLKAASPMVDVKDDRGNFKYIRPIFVVPAQARQY